MAKGYATRNDMDALKAVLPLIDRSGNSAERLGLARNADARAEETHALAQQRELRAQQVEADRQKQLLINNAQRLLNDLKAQRKEKEQLVKDEEQALINFELMHIHPAEPDALNKLGNLAFRYPKGMEVPAMQTAVSEVRKASEKAHEELNKRFGNFGVDLRQFARANPATGEFDHYDEPAMELVAAPGRAKASQAAIEANLALANLTGASGATVPAVGGGGFTFNVAHHDIRMEALNKAHKFTEAEVNAVNAAAQKVHDDAVRIGVPEGLLLTKITKDAEFQAAAGIVAAKTESTKSFKTQMSANRAEFARLKTLHDVKQKEVPTTAHPQEKINEEADVIEAQMHDLNASAAEMNAGGSPQATGTSEAAPPIVQKNSPSASDGTLSPTPLPGVNPGASSNGKRMKPLAEHKQAGNPVLPKPVEESAGRDQLKGKLSNRFARQEAITNALNRFAPHVHPDFSEKEAVRHALINRGGFFASPEDLRNASLAKDATWEELPSASSAGLTDEESSHGYAAAGALYKKGFADLSAELSKHGIQSDEISAAESAMRQGYPVVAASHSDTPDQPSLQAIVDGNILPVTEVPGAPPVADSTAKSDETK